MKQEMPTPQQIINFLQLRHYQGVLFEVVKTAGRDKWDAIRQIYAWEEGVGYDPYLVPWPEIMTPIEKDAWFSIRAIGGMPFYPQYPVGRFFADFGDPVNKIAIECDGKDFHDPDSDLRRDRAFAQQGWRVHRFSGSSLYKGEENDEAAHHGIRQIAERYYR